MHRLWLLLFFGLIGCHKVTYTSTGAPGQSHYVNKIFLFWGAIGSEEINVRKICPTGVYQIQQRRDPGGILISYLTAGIIMPLTVESSAVTDSTSLDNRTIHSGSSDPATTVTCAES